jgi:two-component system CheB/CheR fusion protein
VVVSLVGARVQEASAQVLVALHDVTAIRMAERTLRAEAQRKDQFLGALSHELRNPLWPIRTSLALLERVEPGGNEAHTALAIVGRQVDHLIHIVDDLLDVTRIARGKIRLRRERVALTELVERAVADHRPAFDNAGVALDVALPAEPLWVDGDATRLAQVVGNLLGNALKFTARGGHVALVLRREAHRAALSLRDDGVGIAPEVRERLFEPFQQAPQTLDRSRGGLGLGLAMVKGLVELHEGRVDAYSGGVDKGSEFVVRLPLVEAPGEQAAPPPPRAPQAASRRVLVIEDAEDAAAAIQDLLLLEGHDVRVACDGPRGIETARAFRPEVVLCDIGLPGMDGYAVARAMRRDPALREAHLVALSGYAREEDKAQAAEAGFNCHIAKPPCFEEIEHVLASARPLPAANGAQARP